MLEDDCPMCAAGISHTYIGGTHDGKPIYFSPAMARQMEQAYASLSNLVGPRFKSYERRYLKYKRRHLHAVRLGKTAEVIAYLKRKREKYCYMAYPG